ncbi:MAG: DUF4846 domain-containing protein [Bacteroidota bacterium]
MVVKASIITFTAIVLLSCQPASAEQGESSAQTVTGSPVVEQVAVQDTAGMTIATRFAPPPGFRRMPLPTNSFGMFLRELPLKPNGSKVFHYDGQPKYRQDVHSAVIDMDVGTRDLQQCADAVIRLRAEYFWLEGAYDEINFQFTNGFPAAYRRWRNGERIQVAGNNVTWIPRAQQDTSYQQFRSYLNMVFAYAGTLSLANELNVRPLAEIKIGDVFVQGGSPGHAVIVVDLVRSESSDEVLVLLAQSYMSAQDIHVLKNPRRADSWYLISKNTDVIRTPGWTFSARDLKHF